MTVPIKIRGRPAKDAGKRRHVVTVKLTEGELSELTLMIKQSGMNRMQVIRKKIFSSGAVTMVNVKEVLGELSAQGAELGRAGNNINQLARHANVLAKQGKLHGQLAEELKKLLEEYLAIQTQLDKTWRHLLRAIKK